MIVVEKSSAAILGTVLWGFIEADIFSWYHQSHPFLENSSSEELSCLIISGHILVPVQSLAVGTNALWY